MMLQADIKSSRNNLYNNDLEMVSPQDIERRSFEIIRSELHRDLDPELESIILRTIHATADFD